MGEEMKEGAVQVEEGEASSPPPPAQEAEGEELHVLVREGQGKMGDGEWEGNAQGRILAGESERGFPDDAGTVASEATSQHAAEYSTAGQASSLDARTPTPDDTRSLSPAQWDGEPSLGETQSAGASSPSDTGGSAAAQGGAAADEASAPIPGVSVGIEGSGPPPEGEASGPPGRGALQPRPEGALEDAGPISDRGRGCGAAISESTTVVEGATPAAVGDGGDIGTESSTEEGHGGKDVKEEGGAARNRAGGVESIQSLTSRSSRRSSVGSTQASSRSSGSVSTSTRSGGLKKDSARDSASTSKQPSQRNVQGRSAQMGSDRSSKNVPPPLLAKGSETSMRQTAKAKAKEAEEKEKKKNQERERQAALRQEREAREREQQEKAHHLKERQAHLLEFEATRVKDIADHAKLRSAALERADHAAWLLLYEAAREGDVERVRSLLDPQPTPFVSRHEKTKDNPIVVSLKEVQWAAVELGGGGGNDPGTWQTPACNVNSAGGKMSRTALHAASSSGRAEVVEVLCMDFGAKIDVVDAAGRPPIWDAARHGHLEVVQLLVDAGAKVDTPDLAGNTPTHMAVKNGHNIVVQVLVDAGADLLCVNSDGKKAKQMSEEGSQLSLYLKSLGDLQQTTAEPKKYLQLHIDGQERRDHPDPAHRFRHGHSTFVRGSVFVCERHLETGEFFIRHSSDGFRSSQVVGGPLPQVNSVAAAESGLVLVAFDDGRLLRTQNDFEDVAFVHPGLAHGRGAPLGSDSVADTSFGAVIRNVHVVDSNIAYAVGDAPAEESLQDRVRALRSKAHGAFLHMDTDGSNTLDAGEMLALAKSLGYRLTLEEAQETVNTIDTDGSGKIDFEEFFEWYRDNAKQSRPHPLLLQTRNGGHSFQQIGLPSAAMEIFAGYEYQLLAVAFGGPNKRVGAVLARYGQGQGLLLVTQDGGSFWECIDPQRWYENEKERLVKEREEAAREASRQIQNNLALERKAREEQARKKKLEEEEAPDAEEELSPKGRDVDSKAAGAKEIAAGGGRKAAAALTRGNSSVKGSARSLSQQGSARSLSRQGSNVSSKGDGASHRDSLSSRSHRSGNDSIGAKTAGGLSSRGVSRQGSSLSEASQSSRTAHNDESTGSISSSSVNSRPPSFRRIPSGRGLTRTGSDVSKGLVDEVDDAQVAELGNLSHRSRTGSSSHSSSSLPPIERTGVGKSLSRQGSARGKGAFGDDGDGDRLPNIAPGKKVVEKKDERTLAKEAQLQALLDAKKKKKEEELQQASAPAVPTAQENKDVSLSVAEKEQQSSQTSGSNTARSDRSEQDETVIEIAGRLSRLTRDGSKAVLDTGKYEVDDDDDDEDEEQGLQHDAELAKLLGDDQMELVNLSPDEDEDDDTPVYEAQKKEIKMPPRPDFIPKIDVEGLMEKFQDPDQSDDEEEEEEKEEEEYLGSEPSETARSDLTSSSRMSSRLSSSRSSMSLLSSMKRGSSRSLLAGGRMESSRSLISTSMMSSRSNMSSIQASSIKTGRSTASVLTSRSYLNALSNIYTDEQLVEFSQLPDAEFTSLLGSKPESEREALKLAVDVVRGLQEDNTVYERPVKQMPPVGSPNGASSPVESTISIPVASLDSSSQLSSLGNTSPQNPQIQTLGQPSMQKLTKKPGLVRMATGRVGPETTTKTRAHAQLFAASKLLSLGGSATSSFDSGSPLSGAPADGPQPLNTQNSSSSLRSSTSKLSRQSSSSSKTGGTPLGASASLNRKSSSSNMTRQASGKSLRQDSSKNLGNKRQDSSKSLGSTKDGAESMPGQSEGQLRQLREFTFEKELENARKNLQRELESAEGEERLVTIQLREAIVAQVVEGKQGGPLTAAKIAMKDRLVAAREATLAMMGKIKQVCAASVAQLQELKTKQEDGLKDISAKIAAKEDEKSKLPKRGGDEARKRRAVIDAELEDLEHDRLYFSTNIGYVEEAIEEEELLKGEMLHDRPSIDTWGSRGMDAFAGVVAVAVVSDGSILVAGAGGVQRSTDGGRTWSRTFVISAEVDCTCLQAVGDTVFALVEGAFHRSTDGGVTWTALGKLPPFEVAVWSLVSFVDADHGFAANERGSIYFTSNGGVSWEQRTSVSAGMRFVPGSLSGVGLVPP